MKSTMGGGHIFSMVPQATIPRSSFIRSHGYKTTFNASQLVPVYLDEALPGDTFNLRMQAFARMFGPLKAPLMDNLHMDLFFFAVPYRLVWDNWQKFNGEQDDPGDSIDYTIPVLNSNDDSVGGFSRGTLADYFGIPTGVPNLEVSALPFRAYRLIYNTWFRDQNLINSLTVPKDDGPDTAEAGYGSPALSGKRHDYFTSCLPFPQKGPSVPLPLGGTVNVDWASSLVLDNPAGGGVGAQWIVRAVSDGHALTAANLQSDGAGVLLGGGGSEDAYLDSSGALAASTTALDSAGGTIDLGSVAAATINELRQAFQVQKLYERDARGGTRYTEILRAHFGVVSPDARLQRPEYLGGGSAPVMVHPVTQTSESATTAQGTITAFGTLSARAGFVKSFTEHCFVMGLVRVRADLTYQQGLDRMWSRLTRFDHYWPALAHIGEQAVLNKEIFAQGSAVIDGMTGNPYDDEVFGYQERFAEYRYKPSRITGGFRSTVTAGSSLDFWHLAQDFVSLPLLDEAFISENVPMGRVEAVPSEDDFVFDSYFDLKCARPMPVYSVPGMIDHF